MTLEELNNIDISDIDIISINSNPLSSFARKIYYLLKNPSSYKIAIKSISNADQAKIKKMLKDVKIPSGPAKMPKAVRNMRERMKSKGGAGEAGPAVTKYRNGGCVMAGRGGKFKGIS